MATLDRELQVALDLVWRCGPLAQAIQAGGAETLGLEDKPDDQGPVTRADITVQREILSVLREQFPNDAILAEEGQELPGRDDDWPARARVWMIDPIDGTRDFAEGDSSWAIHIGLCVDQVPVLGVVHEPAMHRTSWGIVTGRERSAWTRDGDSQPRALHGMGALPPRHRMVSSKSHRAAGMDAVSEALGIPAAEQFRCGSTGVKIGMVGRGEAGLYVHPSKGTSLWDTCAPQVLLVGAGGQVTDLFGQALRYGGPMLGNERGILATGRGVDHAETVAKLEAVARRLFG